MRSIAIGLPCFGGLIHMRTAKALSQATLALEREGVAVQWLIVEHESLITRARNLIAHLFLKGTCERLVFIDADITFSPDGLRALLARDEDVVGAAYPKKSLNWPAISAAVRRGEEQPARFAADWVVNVIGQGSGEEHTVPVRDGCLVEVESLGTGFLSLSREALLRVAEAHPEAIYTADDRQHGGEAMVSLFDALVVDGRYLSEDYLFCRRWRDLGGQCWLHLGVPLGHIGVHTYMGDLSAVFQPVEAT